jgi:hypothetical protein
MLFAFLFAALTAFPIADCVPMAWQARQASTLVLLDDSPVNCLIVDAELMEAEFVEEARNRNLKLFVHVPDDELAVETGAQAIAAGADGLYTEKVSPDVALRLSDLAREKGKPFVWLPERVRLASKSDDRANPEAISAVTGTWQGLWAGVKLGHEGEAEAAPTGPPWIDTNSGFLRYVRTVTPAERPVWIANSPPEDENIHVPASRYMQAIGDAELAGAKWVIRFQDAFWQRLVNGEPTAFGAWLGMKQLLRFYHEQRGLHALPDYSKLAIIQDERSGALVSGSVLDMVESKHIPAKVIPPHFLGQQAPGPLRFVLNIDPQTLSTDQAEAVRNKARAGAMVMNGPPGWKVALPPPEAITFSDEQIEQLDEIWKEINRVIGRENFAVRVFGAPSMLSNLKADADGTLVLSLVNYSDYPVEGITVHTLSKVSSVTLLTPEGEESPELYEHEDGSGIDIDRVGEAAVLLLRP